MRELAVEDIDTPDLYEDGVLTIRIVHKSAKRFLPQVYLSDDTKNTNNEFHIEEHKCHEAMARSCLTYLRCQELQIGWAQARPAR
jgi:hypothetical protein